MNTTLTLGYEVFSVTGCFCCSLGWVYGFFGDTRYYKFVFLWGMLCHIDVNGGQTTLRKSRESNLTRGTSNDASRQVSTNHTDAHTTNQSSFVLTPLRVGIADSMFVKFTEFLSERGQNRQRLLIY